MHTSHIFGSTLSPTDEPKTKKITKLFSKVLSFLSKTLEYFIGIVMIIVALNIINEAMQLKETATEAQKQISTSLSVLLLFFGVILIILKGITKFSVIDWITSKRE